MQQRYMGDRGTESLAVGLGWFSIALGVAKIAAPREMAGLIGIRDAGAIESTMRALGAREIASGIGILAQPDRAEWLWSRVAGDAMDLSLLGYAMAQDDTDRTRLAGAAAAVAGVTALDIICAQRLGEANEAGPLGTRRVPRQRDGIHVERVTTVNKPIEQVYAFWRDFQNFPRFMRHIESIALTGDRRSRWRAKGPAGMTVEWEAEIVDDVENERISWRSLEGSQVPNSGTVRFERAPGARGTEVRVQLQYSPPAGALGRGVAWLFGEAPEQQIHEDLHRFKQLMETGEVPLSDGPGLWRPAQPASDPGQVRTIAGVQP